MNIKLARFALAVVLALFAAPSWAAVQTEVGFIPTLRAELFAVEDRFERAFTIELADGTSAVAEMTRSQEWNGSKVGIVEALGQQWEAKEWPDGSRSVRFLDPDDFSCSVRYPAEMPKVVLPEISLNPEAVLGPTTIDVLIMYEPSAAVDAGGEDMLYAMVLMAMDMTNEISVNSGIPQLTFRLAGFEGLSQNQPPSGWWPSDDVEVRLAREFYHADLVHVVVSDLDGFAGLATMYCGGDPNCGYGIIHQQALVGGTLGHEIGHGLGLDHEPAYAGDHPELPDFNKSMYVCFGYDSPNNRKGIMSYGTGPECGSTGLRMNKIPGEGVYEQGVEFWSHDARQVQVVEMFATSVANYQGEVETEPCVPGPLTLCLDSDNGVGDRRFRVVLSFETIQGGGHEGFAEAQPVSGSTVSGLMTFFDPANLEALVKILNGCAVNNRFWLYFASLTNVGFAMTVTDTQLGTVKVYTNPDGTPAPPVQDVDAFTCQ